MIIFKELSETLEIEVGGTDGTITEYDRLMVSGNIELNGTLKIVHVDDFTTDYIAVEGNEFNVIEADGTITGAFTSDVFMQH